MRMNGKVDMGKTISEQYICFRILLPFIKDYQQLRGLL